MKNKIIIWLCAILASFIFTFSIVNYHIHNKTNEIVCNTSYKDENYTVRTKVTFTYVNNILKTHILTEEISSQDKALLEIQKEQYKKNKYDIKSETDKFNATKILSTNIKPKKLLDDYIDNGYKCIGDEL